MKKDIKASDIIIRLVLFFMWPIGIIPLVISKRIKHKVCIAFIYFALCCLLGLPILMCILLPICVMVESYSNEGYVSFQLIAFYVMWAFIMLVPFFKYHFVDKNRGDK